MLNDVTIGRLNCTKRQSLVAPIWAKNWVNNNADLRYAKRKFVFAHRVEPQTRDPKAKIINKKNSENWPSQAGLGGFQDSQHVNGQKSKYSLTAGLFWLKMLVWRPDQAYPKSKVSLPPESKLRALLRILLPFRHPDCSKFLGKRRRSCETSSGKAKLRIEIVQIAKCGNWISKSRRSGRIQIR